MTTGGDRVHKARIHQSLTENQQNSTFFVAAETLGFSYQDGLAKAGSMRGQGPQFCQVIEPVPPETGNEKIDSSLPSYPKRPNSK